MLNKVGDTYFIIDCWNSRILYADTLTNDLNKWKTLIDENYLGGHSVASDGQLYVFDNTDMQQLLVYIKNNDTNEFILSQIIENIEERPHFVLYNNNTELFYVIGSTNGSLYCFENTEGKLDLVYKIFLNEISQSYVRSISIIDNNLYTVDRYMNMI